MKKQFDYPIRVTPKGTVVDEQCRCGALRTEHEPRFAPGHGPCPKTKCKQFTWVAFVYSK